MDHTKPDVSSLWNIVELAIENDEELADYEYIEEYIDPFDEPEEADIAGSSDEVESKHTVQIHSVQIGNGEVENSVWSSTPPEVGAGRKIAQAKSGPLGLAKGAKSPSECLSLFLDADVIATITEYTNERIKTEKNNYSRERDANETDETEILAFLGILYIAGTVRDGRQKIEYIFEAKNGTGMEAVFLTMGLHRFHFLSRCLQFDDPTTTEEETEADKLAPIRAIYERIVGNFQKFFRPGRLLTLDEQLIPFRGKCAFRQCIPLKPCNLGLRFNLLVDCDVPYTCHMEVCVPHNHKPYDLSYAPADVAMRMTEPIQGKYKTVIMGSPKLTSLETIKKLHDSRTMVIGEVKKSLNGIPKPFTASKGRTERDTLIAYHEMATLISHMVRSKDLLILMSSHREESSETETVNESTGEMRDPPIVQIYNRSKNVVQLIQQMCSTYDVGRACRRWQMAVFFNLMNLSAINAWCIYRMNHPENTTSRRDFLTDMALELLRPQARRRLDFKTIPPVLKQRIGIFLGVEKSEYDAVPMERRKGARGRCYMCGRTRNKTTRNCCDSCSKFVCSDHFAYICLACYNAENAESY